LRIELHLNPDRVKLSLGIASICLTCFGPAPNPLIYRKPGRYRVYRKRSQMNPLSDTQPVRRGGIKRGVVTFYCYLMYGFFLYLLTIEGNIIPFLKSELNLSYGAVSLHSSAFAAGGIATGVFGDRLIRRYGRRLALLLGVLGMSTGAAMLCLASAVWASIGSCALMGALGGLILIVVNAVLAELHGERRSVAYAEASAIAYAFGIVAPLAMSLCLSLSLGWRNAVLLGVAFGGIIVLWFGRASLPDPTATSASGRTSLPASYWACWCALVLAVAIEFCILLWAPEFLEHVVGVSKASAAAAAAVSA
jgi:MFS family permease